MRKYISLILIVIAQLAACSSSNITMSPAKPSPIASFTPETMPQVIEQTPTLTSIPSKNTMSDQCWSTLSNLSSEVTLPGKLVLSSPEGLSILDFNKQTRREIKELINYAAVSPNAESLSYSYQPQDEKEKLIIESNEGKIRAQVPVAQGWLTYYGMPWLDNERLWFSVFPDIMQGQVAHVVIINPFTGEQQELSSDYPGLERYQFGMANSPGLHFEYSSVVYNPSLQLVIYPQETEDGWYITLWDRQSQKVLAKLLDGGLYGHPPIWMPDGNQFVVVAKPDWDSPREWEMVSLDGDIRQLTHFKNLYTSFEIGGYASISPDGNYLAFGLSQNDDSNTTRPKQLVILNLKTLEAINTCVSFSNSTPVWSPDSIYIAVLTHNSSNKLSSAVILNIEHKWVANLSESLKAEPVGWMK